MAAIEVRLRMTDEVENSLGRDHECPPIYGGRRVRADHNRLVELEYVEAEGPL